jgi:cell division septum initiation protein DivIVA
MDAGSPFIAQAHRRLEVAPTSEAYARADLADALVDLATQRDALRRSIDEADERIADLRAAAECAGSLHEDLAGAWLEAEHHAAAIRSAAEHRALEILRDAEARAAGIVAAALAGPRP